MARRSLSKTLLESGYRSSASTAPAFDLRIEQNTGKAFSRFLHDAVNGGLERILSLSSWQLANLYAGALRSAYRNSEYRRSPLTLAMYEEGYVPGENAKSKGKYRWEGTRPFIRSGVLADSIVVRKGLKQGKFHTYEVRFKDATYGQLGGGDPHDAKKKVAHIAAQLEDPSPVVIKVTGPMLQLLVRTFRSTESGKKHARRVGQKHLTNAGMRKGSVIAYVPSRKPVVAGVNRRIGRLYPRWASFVKTTFKKYAEGFAKGRSAGAPKIRISTRMMGHSRVKSGG